MLLSLPDNSMTYLARIIFLLLSLLDDLAAFVGATHCCPLAPPHITPRSVILRQNTPTLHYQHLSYSFTY